MKKETCEAGVGAFERVWVKAASAAVVALRWPVAAVTGKSPDPWRRVVGLGLRSDGTKFGLSAFGLDLFSDFPAAGTAPTRSSAESHFAKRWAEFLAGEPEATWVLRHHAHHVERSPGNADVVVARFTSNGELEKIEPAVRSPDASPADIRGFEKIAEAFCKAHQTTRDLPERQRPQALLLAAGAGADEISPGSLKDPKSWNALRLAAACQVSFEPMPESAERVLPPDFRLRRSAGCGVLNVVARLSGDFRSVDVWLQIHHVGADGAPIQEMLTRLEKAWGVASAPCFPADNRAKEPRLISVQPSPQDRPLSEAVDFINFAPLLAWRDAMNKKYRDRMGVPAPVVCALTWHLARQPEFAGRKFSTTADVPATAQHARAVAMAGIRPADYSPDDEGFVAFTRNYLQLLEKARTRTTAGWLLTRQVALLPPWLALKALKADASRGREIFGTVGVSILKDARVFSAPMEDVGWYDGFLAIGNLTLPADGGKTVAAVTARGEVEVVRKYPRALRVAIQACPPTL